MYFFRYMSGIYQHYTGAYTEMFAYTLCMRLVFPHINFFDIKNLFLITVSFQYFALVSGVQYSVRQSYTLQSVSPNISSIHLAPT